MKNLLDMLTYGRPSSSATERAFVARFIETLPGAWQDVHGNWHVTVGSDSSVLWSAHTDTVHRAPGRYTVARYGSLVTLSRGARKLKTSCLGADDSVGCYLLTELIARGIPGHYVFHHAEEIGGIGSSDLARVNGDWLKQFRFAIALDRGGFSDVITHQGGTRTSSQAFANALAGALNCAEPSFTFQPSSRGIFTDTANYDGLIPECTNISVGYERAHTDRESVDLNHVARLLDALSAVDVEALPSERPLTEPFAMDEDWPWFNERPTYARYRSLWDTREPGDDDDLADTEDRVSDIWLDRTMARVQSSLKGGR